MFSNCLTCVLLYLSPVLHVALASVLLPSLLCSLSHIRPPTFLVAPSLMYFFSLPLLSATPTCSSIAPSSSLLFFVSYFLWGRARKQIAAGPFKSAFSLFHFHILFSWQSILDRQIKKMATLCHAHFKVNAVQHKQKSLAEHKGLKGLTYWF